MSREGISLAVEALIAKLDTMDGDPDAEFAGDEQDGQFGEDEDAARFGRLNHGPGCLIADGDGVNGDEADSCFGEDEALTFEQRSRAQGAGCPVADEDFGESRDYRQHRNYIRAMRCDQIGHRHFPEYRLRAPAAGCPIGDPGEEQEEN